MTYLFEPEICSLTIKSYNAIQNALVTNDFPEIIRWTPTNTSPKHTINRYYTTDYYKTTFLNYTNPTHTKTINGLISILNGNLPGNYVATESRDPNTIFVLEKQNANTPIDLMINTVTEQSHIYYYLNRDVIYTFKINDANARTNTKIRSHITDKNPCPQPIRDSTTLPALSPLNEFSLYYSGILRSNDDISHEDCFASCQNDPSCDGYFVVPPPDTDINQFTSPPDGRCVLLQQNQYLDRGGNNTPTPN